MLVSLVAGFIWAYPHQPTLAAANLRPATPAATTRIAVAPPAPATTTTTTEAQAPAPPPPRPAEAGTPLPISTAAAWNGDFPDPHLLQVGSEWWAYSTGSGLRNVQVMSSADLHHWSPLADALPLLPRWAEVGYSWAPRVLFIGGRYVMYYAAREAAVGRQCLSVATSPTPGGPFTDTSTEPLSCQVSDGGSIDPFPFLAPDGSLYLVWKSEDNGIGSPSRIGAQRLNPDGLTLVGPRPRLLTARQRWQAGVVEGPAMVASGGRFYLFYGGNHWDSAAAGIGYATCLSPLGPCTDASVTGPWLATHGAAVGPSGPDVFIGGDGATRIVYHAWAGAVGYPGGRRTLWIDALEPQRRAGAGVRPRPSPMVNPERTPDLLDPPSGNPPPAR